MECRKNAYQSVLEELGKLRIVDRKGTWVVGDLIRIARHSASQSDFYFYITLEANQKDLPRAGSFPILGHIFIRQRESADVLKRRIREQIGYTPIPDSMREIWARFLVLCSAYEEEDRYYASCDKKAAEAVLESLIRKAGERCLSGENLLEEHRRHSYPIMENFLTKEELQEATEAQKIMNGHSFEEFMKPLYMTGHLASFNRRIRDYVHDILRRKQWEEERRRDRMILEKLDSDVQLRKLVAHALIANQDIRTSNIEYELVHRLFGYSRNLDEYRERLTMFEEMLKPYNIRYYEAYKLVAIGREYLDNGGMLPVVHALHERVPGRFYYMDDVHDGVHKYKVIESGIKYVRTDKGSRLLKKSVRHFERVQLIDRPQRVQEALYNILADMHNRKAVPLAHQRGLMNVVKSLAASNIRKENIQRAYEEMRDTAENEFLKEAYQLIVWGIHYLKLQKHIETLQILHNSGSSQSCYAAAVREMSDLQMKLQPYISLESVCQSI